MKKIIFLFCITLGLAQNNGIRSLNGSLNNSQRLTVDTTSSATFRWGLSNGVHTLYLPYRIVSPSSGSFKWNVSGQTAKYDSLRLIAGSNVSLTQSGNTVTIATSGGGSVGNADSLGGVPASDYARLSVANTFTAINNFRGDSTYFQRSSIGSSGTGTGTVTFLVDSVNVYGTGTAFTTELVVGQIITIDGFDYTIQSITSNTLLTVTSVNTEGDATGVGFTYSAVPFASFEYRHGALVADGDYSFHPSKKSTTRFLWLPKTGSFRAGNASSTQWDSANIGFRSVAFGGDNTSSGNYSFSAGFENTASGQNSTVFGTLNTASGSSSTIFGSSNTASGNSSWTGGIGNTNSGTGTFAFGTALSIRSGLVAVNMFGTNVNVARQTTGGFAYANSADTIRMGHATFSWNVPFVAGNNTTAAGGVGSALILYNEASDDTSAFTLGQTLGVGGSGGTTTTSFSILKTKGTDPANNDKPNGNKYISLFAVDTSNNIIFNASKSSHFNYGNMSIANGNFTASTGNITATTGAISGATITGTSYVDGDDSVFTSSADSWMGAESGGITPRLAFVKASGFGPELRFLSSSASLFTVRRVTGGTLLAPSASTVDMQIGATGNVAWSGGNHSGMGTISSGAITSTGLSTFGDNAGTATIGAGDSVQVTVTGLTVATGQAVVSYKRKGATSVIVADTIATYDINTANKLSIYGKYGWTVSYWVGKK